MTGDSNRRPTTHNRIWIPRDITFWPRGGRSGTLAARRAERLRLTLISRGPPPEMSRTNGGAQAARGGAHRGHRALGAVLLGPQPEDQQAPEIPAVVGLQIA